MRKFCILLITSLLTLLGGKAYAYDCEVDGIYYYRISATELEVANKVFSDQNRTAYSGAVTIPSTVTYNGKTFNVVSIGEYAFRDCTGLTAVTIPTSVKTIKSYAFYNCTSIAQINLPASVTTIGAGAFEGCSSLASMVLPSGLSSVEPESFYDCTALRTVVLPGSVSSIGADAFSRCTSLINVYLLANSMPKCDASAFDKVDRTWCTLYVARGSAAYQNDQTWGEFFIEEFSGSADDIKLDK